MCMPCERCFSRCLTLSSRRIRMCIVLLKMQLRLYYKINCSLQITWWSSAPSSWLSLCPNRRAKMASLCCWNIRQIPKIEMKCVSLLRNQVCSKWASISSFFLLFLNVKSQASGTTTRTVVGQRRGKHSFGQTSIAMWPGPNPPTWGQKSLCCCIHVGSKAPTSCGDRKSLSVSDTLTGIQNISPPVILLDEIRVMI